jgi:hypothetical protein
MVGVITSGLPVQAALGSADARCVRERNAARNLALLRKIALNLARVDTTLKASLRGKRKHAGWDDAFTAALIAG